MYADKKSIWMLVCLNIIKAIAVFVFIIGIERIIINFDFRNVTYICSALIGQYMSTTLIQYVTNTLSLREYGHRDGLIQNKIKDLDYCFFESKECQDSISVFRTTIEKEVETINAFSKTIYGITNGVMFIIFLFLSSEKRILFVNITILFIILGFTCLAERKLSKYMYDYWEKYKKNIRLYNAIADILLKKDYVEEKKIFNHSQFFSDIFCKEFKRATYCNDEIGKKRRRMELVSESCVIFFLLFQLFVLLFSLKTNIISINFFVAIISYLATIFSAIAEGLYAIPDVIRARRLSKKFDLFINDKSIEKIIFEEEKCDSKYVIKMENIIFSYNNDTNVIENLSCCFERGKKYAVIGVNGSGKTTLVKLISGLYKVKSGNICRNGKVKVLFQDFNKYPYTFEENIFLGKNSHDRSSYINILDLSDTYIRNSDVKMNTLYEKGIDVSGGQWQRIALSRLLCDEADIIILDEPTSNLDPIIEAKIFEEYIPKLQDKTLIIISHRLGNIKGVDQIITMDKGKIVEKGTHKELMENEKSLYRAMYEKQKALYF